MAYRYPAPVQRMRTVILTGLLGVLVASTTAQELPPDLAKAEQTYDLEVLRLEGDARAQLTDWPRRYLQDLSSIENRAQLAGDLDLLLAVREEKKQFVLSGAAEPPKPVSPLEAVRALQQRYQTETSAYGVERDRKILALSDKFIAYLDARMRALTREGQLEAALAFRDAIERARNTPERAQAERTLQVTSSSSASPFDSPAASTTPPSPFPAAVDTAWVCAEDLGSLSPATLQQVARALRENRVRLYGLLEGIEPVEGGMVVFLAGRRARVEFAGDKPGPEELAQIERALREGRHGPTPAFSDRALRLSDRRTEGKQVQVSCSARYAGRKGETYIFQDARDFRWREVPRGANTPPPEGGTTTW